MTKAVAPRARAQQDIRDAIRWYRREAGANVALGFVSALEDAFERIGAKPGTGSPRFAELLDLPGLRSRSLRRHPYLIFYVELADRIDVWRVLHAKRDIPASLAE